MAFGAWDWGIGVGVWFLGYGFVFRAGVNHFIS